MTIVPGDNPFTGPPSPDRDDGPVVDDRKWSEPEFYNRADAAERIGRAASTVRRWERAGEIEFYLGFVSTADLLDTERRMRMRGGDQEPVESRGDLLSLKDATERINVGRSTLYRWIANGDLVVIGKRVRVADLLEADRRMKRLRGRPSQTAKESETGKPEV